VYSARGSACAWRAPVGEVAGRDGTRTGCTAEPGSSPWAAASTAPAVGWLKRDAVSAVCSGQPRKWRPLPLATVRATHMATAGSRRRGLTRHDGERRRRHENRPKARPRLQGCGACVLGCTPVRGRRGRKDAHANAKRTRQHGAAATKIGRRPTARGGWLGGRRACVGEGGSTCKKLRPSLARWPASPAAARRRGAAGVPPRLEGRGVHKREEAGVLTSVATGRSEARR
jgi:hypothetical protein